MTEKPHRIFRPSAIRHYEQSRQLTTLPVYLSPRVFVLGWVCLIALMGVGIVIIGALSVQ